MKHIIDTTTETKIVHHDPFDVELDGCALEQSCQTPDVNNECTNTTTTDTRSDCENAE